MLVLLLGGVGAGTGIGFGLWHQKEISNLSNSSPQLAEKNDQVFPPVDFPESESESESEPKTITQPEENPPSETESSPEVIEPSEQSSQANPTPNPEPPPVSALPKPQPSAPPKPTAKKRLGESEVPILRPGTSKEQIIQALGQPSSQNKGYWPNTQSWLYKNHLGNQVDLGYILDTNTGRLRQTEVSFASSVNLEVMENTLNGLLDGKTPETITSGLAEVYNRQNDLRSFSLENIKGMIHRNNKDQIYIAIWEEDFH